MSFPYSVKATSPTRRRCREARELAQGRSTLGPFKDGKPGLERSISYHNLNAGKRSLTVDIKDLARPRASCRPRLFYDVLIESQARVCSTISISPTRSLKARNPALIVASTSLLGQTGPHARGTSGAGTMGAPMPGASLLLGWPGHALLRDLRAVDRRHRTAVHRAQHPRRPASTPRDGRRVATSTAQAEAGSIQFLSPASVSVCRERHGGDGAARPLLKAFAAGRRTASSAVPARTAGSFSICLMTTPGRPCARLSGVPLASTLDTLIGRLRSREDLEGAISAWTTARQADELERSLQAAGVPAHGVSNSSDLAHDPDLLDAHYRRIDDPIAGEAIVEGPRYRLGRTRSATRRGPRTASTPETLRDLCGYDAAAIDDLKAAGVLVVTVGTPHAAHVSWFNRCHPEAKPRDLPAAFSSPSLRSG